MVKKEDLIRYAIYIVVIIAIIWLSRKLIHGVVGAIHNAKLLNQYGKEINVSNLTYPTSQYDTFADSLYRAMKGLGTDDGAVRNIFNKMETRDDVLRLIKSFGSRENETLQEWLEGDGCTDYVNKILQSKSIEFSF